MNMKKKPNNEEINEELFTEVGGQKEKVELSHPAVTFGKRALRFIGENFNFSPGLIVSGKQIPVSFTLRFPLAKVFKKIKL
jgi:hypothetical protein